jgi:hypothetical protein
VSDQDRGWFKRKWVRIALRTAVAIGALVLLFQAVAIVLVGLNLGKG